MEGIDAEEAADHVADPEDPAVSYPFNAPISHRQEHTNASQKETSEPSRKGIKSQPKLDKNKYGHHNIPALIKKLCKKLCKIPIRWRKYYLKTGSASLAKNTWSKYASAFNAYEQFCMQENLVKPWPLSKNSTTCFILWCKKIQNLRASTIKGYLSALKTISSLLGTECKDFKSSEKLLIRGIERTEKQNLRKQTDPLIFQILVEIRNKLKLKKWKKHSKKVVWACICLGYFGSFRAGELLTKHPNSFDISSTCTWSDIQLISNSKMSVRIKNPKTGGGKPEIVDLFSFPDKCFCPIKALKTLKKSSIQQENFQHEFPVFRFGSGKFLTVSALSDIFKSLLSKGKFSKKKISAKSMRSGIPTDLENHPALFNDLHIKIWGRWKSKTYQKYMKDDKYQREWIFNKICTVLTPLCS